ncbi:ArdC family protein [Muricoccus radiodurans]|uniref:ArdC family protein n=1 Tax=Muricoccus radiodurans TaxID=2231721 RepID=UPI003CF4C168
MTAAQQHAPARGARSSTGRERAGRASALLPSPADAGSGRVVPGTGSGIPVEERADVYARVTEAIVAAIEAGAARGTDWRMPWHRRRDAGAAPALPLNVASRAAYRGVNVLALWAAAEARGYGSGLWGTYRQWSELGGQVRRGERATTVVFWRFPAGVGRDNGAGGDADGGGTGDGEDTPRRGPWARAYAVFNAAQVDGATLPTDTAPRLPEETRIGTAEAFFSRLPGLDLRHGGTAAFYAPATDHVQVPAFADFRTAEGYYATLAHEVTHWTGHPSRLARDLTGRFGGGAYAAEELVAELGAAFLLASLGLATEPRADHARYVAHWLDLLRGDKRAVFTAAGRAQSAADWLCGAARQPGQAAAAE